MKNDAFISYSHARDTSLATDLETALEKFAKPLFRRRALTIFRDENHLSASPDLWASIEANLEASEYFILMASPESAQSKWCRKEVAYWIENKSMDKFLIALTGGELAWDESRGDFDWEKTNAIPDNLAGKFQSEPLYVDCREPIPEEQRHFNNPAFEKIVVQFAATLHGKIVGDMIGEASRQHRRNLMIRNTAIVVLSILTVLAVLFYIDAEQQSQLAQKRQEKAEKATEQAQNLLQLVLKGRGKRYQEQPIDTVIRQLNYEQERPLEELVEIRAMREEVNQDNYDYMIWLDIPSFRTDEIREVRYEWPEEGYRYARESFVSREPSTGYAFSWRGVNRVKDEIRIQIVRENGASLTYDFPIRNELQITYRERIERK